MRNYRISYFKTNTQPNDTMVEVLTMKTDDVDEVSMDFELFSEMKDWCHSKKLFSTSYNHGWKQIANDKHIWVDRQYTVNFCFQQTSIDEGNTIKEFFKIIRRGSSTTKYGPNSSPEDRKRLAEETPTFEAMIYPAVTRRRYQVRYIKRGVSLKNIRPISESWLSETNTSSLKITDKNIKSIKFVNFSEAKAWAKENPGRVITKSSDGSSYIVKNDG
jgi:hypothetical protein